jgi:hypothetical protein
MLHCYKDLNRYQVSDKMDGAYGMYGEEVACINGFTGESCSERPTWKT